MPRPENSDSRKVNKREKKVERRGKNKGLKKYSAVLSDREIRRAHRRGDIVISPFRENHVKPNSYDVCLGGFYYRQKLPDAKKVMNIYAPGSKMWLSHACHAWTLKEYILTKHNPARHDQTYDRSLTPKEIETIALRDFENISLGDRVIIIKPGETILGHTEEFVGGVEGVTTMIKTRSSLGRNNIGICKCAGWGDTGFTNRWTLEITNFSNTQSVMLVCGRRVGQIVFMSTGPVQAKYSSKYQSSSESTQQMIADWEPKQMLPRLDLDEECLLSK